ncbi:MAG: nucleotidyltransferase domain-containing protein [Calditrichaeota bacterium]|nr:nucleotidyltransferase domain-containing protein [Calditrichota bacterium]
MKMTRRKKEEIKKEIKDILSAEKEVERIIIFGSFLNSENPNDIDIAIFQNSQKSYLSLALKYRKLMRMIAKKISLDVIPIRSEPLKSSFLSEIEGGELIYERRK